MDMAMETYQLTKLDVAALRKADRLYVAFNGPKPELTRLEAVKENRPTETDPYPQDLCHEIKIPVTVCGYGFHGSLSSYLTEEEQSRVVASTFIYLYHSQCTAASTIINLLKAGDLVRLQFVADNNSEVMRSAGMHSDVLQLFVARGSKQMVFWLDDSIGPDNSARMIRHLPRHPIAA
jgi:hypothetical protein